MPLKIFVGRTPPAAGQQVLLAVVTPQRDDRILAHARVLAVDASVDPAYVTVVLSRSHAVALATIPKPQIQLIEEPAQ